MASPRELLERFRTGATDSVLVGAAGLRAKDPVIIADQALGARGVPAPVSLDSFGETYAIHATHPKYGRRVAALVTLGRQWLDAGPPEPIGPAIPIDTGRIVQLGAACAATLRDWAGGARWLETRDGPPASHQVETPSGWATVIVSDTGIGDGSYTLWTAFRARKKQASILLVDFELIGREGWTTARG